uniref:Uncharacterized protein n=1 Tax=Rhizophora mucronata TaxID=61149 RepID=A0A2P2K2B7_RHIMU
MLPFQFLLVDYSLHSLHLMLLVGMADKTKNRNGTRLLSWLASYVFSATGIAILMN